MKNCGVKSRVFLLLLDQPVFCQALLLLAEMREKAKKKVRGKIPRQEKTRLKWLSAAKPKLICFFSLPF